jgi:predicted Zn-dependent peptidase
MYELSTLDNGLRLVTVHMPHAYSISMGIYLAVGARYEEDRLAGASHFIEHVLFKGTERRPSAREIAFAIESVGGDLNASTGHEMTSYYARVSRDHLAIASDVLLDMLRGSRFRAEDVERERQVIIEEINESLDSPDDLVHMQFQRLLWPDHPLGADIAGTRESVRGTSRDDLCAFMDRSYRPERAVVAIAGPSDHQTISDLISPLLADWQTGNGLHFRPAAPMQGPAALVTNRPLEQAHFLLGMRGLDRFDDDRFALSLLTIILGEGMSSRLFTEIREERGLAYSVYAYAMQLLDTGAFAIYAGVDARNLGDAIAAVLGQLHRLREEPVSAVELAMAKAYARGRTLLRLEDSGANAGWIGSQMALTGRILTPDEVLARLDQVTAGDITQVARRLFRNDSLVLSVVGPVDESEDWQSLLVVE